MKKIIMTLIGLSAAVGFVTAVPAIAGASAVSEARDGVNQVGGNQNNTTLQGGLRTIVNILLFIIGAIAVIMIIIGGIRYTTSGGDSSSITSAKNTILYAVIGLVVAVLAYAIVEFVLGEFI